MNWIGWLCPLRRALNPLCFLKNPNPHVASMCSRSLVASSRLTSRDVAGFNNLQKHLSETLSACTWLQCTTPKQIWSNRSPFISLTCVSCGKTDALCERIQFLHIYIFHLHIYSLHWQHAVLRWDDGVQEEATVTIKYLFKHDSWILTLGTVCISVFISSLAQVSSRDCEERSQTLYM